MKQPSPGKPAKKDLGSTKVREVQQEPHGYSEGCGGHGQRDFPKAVRSQGKKK